VGECGGWLEPAAGSDVMSTSLVGTLWGSSRKREEDGLIGRNVDYRLWSSSCRVRYPW
jgi:hypothetical protein